MPDHEQRVLDVGDLIPICAATSVVKEVISQGIVMKFGDRKVVITIEEGNF